MKRMLALVLSVVLLLSLLPMIVSVSAAGTPNFTANWQGGKLTIEWNDSAYTIEKVRLNGTEVDADGNGSSEVDAENLRPGQKVEVGFSDDDGTTVEWAEAATVKFILKTTVNAYKANGYLNVKVTDEFGSGVPGTVDILLDYDATLSNKPLDNGSYVMSLSRYSGCEVADVSFKGNDSDETKYLPSMGTADLTVEDKEVVTRMQVTSLNDKIQALVIDEDGIPMIGVTVVMDFGSNKDFKTAVTDEHGVAKFNVAASDSVKIVCRVKGWTDKHITYKGCEETYVPDTSSDSTSTSSTTTNKGTSTTTKKDSTTTDGESTTTTTTESIGIVTGVGTTAYPTEHPGFVAVNAIFDTAVIKAFGLTDKEFLRYAQLLIKEEDYQSLKQEDAIVYFSLENTTATITMEQIRAAIEEDYTLVGFRDEQISHATAILGAQLLTGSGETITLMLNDSEYIVRLPIPASMKGASLIAVSQQLGDGISEPIFSTVKDGYFQFSTANLAELVFLGFTEEKVEGKNTYVVFTVIFIVIGVLLLVGAGLILYFAVLRKPKEENKEEDEMTDLYSGDPMDAVSDDGDIVIAPSDDLGDLPPIQDDLFSDIILPDSDDQ